jgi:hypothetical protein
LRSQPFPVGVVGGRNEFIHSGGFSFARPAAHLGAHSLGRQVVSGL